MGLVCVNVSPNISVGTIPLNPHHSQALRSGRQLPRPIEGKQHGPDRHPYPGHREQPLGGLERDRGCHREPIDHDGDRNRHETGHIDQIPIALVVPPDRSLEGDPLEGVDVEARPDDDQGECLDGIELAGEGCQADLDGEPDDDGTGADHEELELGVRSTAPKGLVRRERRPDAHEDGIEHERRPFHEHGVVDASDQDRGDDQTQRHERDHLPLDAHCDERPDALAVGDHTWALAAHSVNISRCRSGIPSIMGCARAEDRPNGVVMNDCVGGHP